MTKVIFTNSEFIELRQKVEQEYRVMEDVLCPYLNTKITFNAKGLDHIKLKGWNKARNRNDQYMRFKLLHLAPEVLRKSYHVQGIEQGNRFERIKIHSRWEQKMTYVSYYEFIAVLKGCRIRVIVKRIENGPPYFWSIIPYWRQSQYGKKLFDGDPESD